MPHTETIAELFEREYDAMLRLAFVLTRSQQDAEEIVQDAFVEVAQRWTTLLNPGAYLRTVVVNGARRHLRRARRRRDILERVAPSSDTVVAGDLEYIVDALDTLPERQRTAVVLAYYGDFGASEIAAMTGCRTGTAKSLVHRGLRRLRRELSHD